MNEPVCDKRLIKWLGLDVINFFPTLWNKVLFQWLWSPWFPRLSRRFKGISCEKEGGYSRLVEFLKLIRNAWQNNLLKKRKIFFGKTFSLTYWKSIKLTFSNTKPELSIFWHSDFEIVVCFFLNFYSFQSFPWFFIFLLHFQTFCLHLSLAIVSDVLMKWSRFSGSERDPFYMVWNSLEKSETVWNLDSSVSCL